MNDPDPPNAMGMTDAEFSAAKAALLRNAARDQRAADDTAALERITRKHTKREGT